MPCMFLLSTNLQSMGGICAQNVEMLCLSLPLLSVPSLVAVKDSSLCVHISIHISVDGAAAVAESFTVYHLTHVLPSLMFLITDFFKKNKNQEALILGTFTEIMNDLHRTFCTCVWE